MVYTGSRAALGAFPDARRVLLVKDDYVAGAHLIGQDPQRVEEELRRAVEAADAVVAVSPVLRDRLRRFGVEAEVIPAGCETVPGPVAAAPDGRAPRAVFLGGLSPRVLPEHLQAVLDAGLELVVLGELRRNFPEGRQLSALRAVLEHPRVQWRGAVGPELVTEVMRTVDVGLVPYDASSFNAASFPLKILEYLAAGVPVVSTPLPALDWLGSDQVHVAADSVQFGELAHEVARNATTAVRMDCRAFAAGHTWERRAEAWLDLLGLCTEGHRTRRAS